MGGVQFGDPRLNGTMPAMGIGLSVAPSPAMHFNAGQPLMRDRTPSALVWITADQVLNQGRASGFNTQAAALTNGDSRCQEK